MSATTSKFEVTDGEIDKAIMKADSTMSSTADASTAASSTTATSSADEDPSTINGMVSVMRKHSDGTNVIKESIQTFSNPDGSDKKGDKWVDDKEDGTVLMARWVEEARTNPKVKAAKREKWNFDTSPHEQFGKTKDDLYTAFVMWSRAAEGDLNDNDKKKKESKQTEQGTNDATNDATTTTNNDNTKFKYNISKAFRRLESYANWMKDSGGDEISKPPLTADSVRDCNKAWGMRSSISKTGQFVWWFDFSKIDLDAIKHKFSVTQHTRAFVWFAHAIMYHPNAQEHGMVFCEDVNKIGFLQTFTLVPPKLGTKLDRLTIGVLPVKMTEMYMLHTPTWMDMFMKFMGMFMSKKMKQRMHPLKDNEWGKLEEALGGKEYILKGFSTLDGTLEDEPIEALHFAD
uniref:CRAL-TRIO domain-containing protein n=1 Tax=Craspedostauros australis TaxID=1486917 RepID=A0A7R9WWU0_9STRA|mmetsp:Transcript_22443/g.62628  ORF Transcript_22443/g.62628 Transcript_22443/m.62628 type:complete len:402 (+) Transcript_22443:59-1264(+)|eukprot:CAMPEP_0198111036 /NCGR_PEP_ID=MMETSP1442-20131203/3005_1 /TAXON_ID= /ORGANISM="Craspedostauros australis, Strain CCMP3328" /LENGTH=401 /DNA_ID=CAMNT_0043767317 /DNA_START=91 /DNA_END=1296 /DNA_ORIENTATION=-